GVRAFISGRLDGSKSVSKWLTSVTIKDSGTVKKKGLRTLQTEAPDVFFSGLTTIAPPSGSSGAASDISVAGAATTTASSTRATVATANAADSATVATSSVGNVELASPLASLLNVAASTRGTQAVSCGTLSSSPSLSLFLSLSSMRVGVCMSVFKNVSSAVLACYL
uniref:Secreted protein n=1 Tax=Mesocestoides corti TaxID=53468 RepID=A0A5K3FV46_MESCO